MSDCPFCKILAGELPSSEVYQDQHCTVIMDIQPINPGHMLVLPNEHVTHLTELEPDQASHLFLTAREMAAGLMDSGIEAEGFNLWLADGKAAFQEVPHAHIHVIPRFADDGFAFEFSPRYFELPTRDELEKNAYHIRQALGKGD
jgi:histidine triad (HIT) family protein